MCTLYCVALRREGLWNRKSETQESVIYFIFQCHWATYYYRILSSSFEKQLLAPVCLSVRTSLSLYLSLSLLCSSDGSTRLSSEEFLVNCPFDNSTKNVCTFIWLESEYKQVTIYVKMCVFCELRTWIEKKLEHHTSIMIERKRLNTYF